MNNSKPLWQSRTLIAALVGLLALLLEAIWGVEVGEDMVQELTDSLIPLLAFIATILGRLAATRTLT